MSEIRTTQLGAMPVRYRVCGQGPPLLLIHGLSASMSCWARNIPVLARYFTVYALDLPGFGCMRQHAKSFSVALAPQWVRSFCEALDLRQVSIVAHSMGGLIALSFTAQWPTLVERLVLAAPPVGMSHRPVLSFAIPMLTSTFRGSVAYLPTLVADSIRCGPFIVWRAGREVLATNVEHQLGCIHAPTLLIWGAQDPLVPPSLAPAIREAIAGSELRILDNAGHVVMFDRAEAFNEAALGFLLKPLESRS